MRYAGGKSPLASKICKFLPIAPEKYHYHEPFCGMVGVGRYCIRNGIRFRSYNFSDKNEWVARLLLALRGDLTSHGDIFERVEEARSRLLPEEDHRYSIKREFEKSRIQVRDGDYFAYLFLLLHAHQHIVIESRPDVAPYSQQYIGGGISRCTPAKMLEWRTILKRATVQQSNAFDLIPTLGTSDCCYVDSPYVNRRYVPGSLAYQLYGHDFAMVDHYKLACILKKTSCKWVMSYNDDQLIRHLYKGYFIVQIPRRKSQRQAIAPQNHELLITNCY